MEQLLTTKLYIPHTRPKIVFRPRLIEQLNAGLHGKLTLISAPAGFGKTTLISEWVQAMDRATPPIAIAWLSLDENDNDPIRFLIYSIAALRTIDANIAKGALSCRLGRGTRPNVPGATRSLWHAAEVLGFTSFNPTL